MFLVNPTTWTDIKRGSNEKSMPWIWSAWFCGPFGFISEVMKFQHRMGRAAGLCQHHFGVFLCAGYHF